MHCGGRWRCYGVINRISNSRIRISNSINMGLIVALRMGVGIVGIVVVVGIAIEED